MPEDVNDLGDRKLSIYYMNNERILSDVKKEISDHLYETLKIEIDNDRLNDTERFYEGIQNIEMHILPEMRKELIHAMDIKRRLDKEIRRRQMNMLKDIGIITPNGRVLDIMKITQGQHFHIFSDMIRYIKLYRKGKAHKWPKNKTIQKLKIFEEMEKKLKTTTLTILANNLGPCSN